MMIYAFDVDETLEVSGGPVRVQALCELRSRGHIIGVCGNWAVACAYIDGWSHLFSFVGPIGSDKPSFLQQLKTYIAADDYVLVGNDHARGAFQSPNDAAHAAAAGWRFISEADFAGGAR